MQWLEPTNPAPTIAMRGILVSCERYSEVPGANKLTSERCISAIRRNDCDLSLQNGKCSQALLFDDSAASIDSHKGADDQLSEMLLATDVRRSCKSSLQWFARYLPEHAIRPGAKLPYTAQVQCGTARWRTFGLLQTGRLFIMHGRKVDTPLTVARESQFSRTWEFAANTRPFSLSIHCEEGTVTPCAPARGL
jgi:hypothetical protein